MAYLLCAILAVSIALVLGWDALDHREHQAAEARLRAEQEQINTLCESAAKSIRQIAARWADAQKLASVTPRIALAPQIGALQKLRHETLEQAGGL